MPRSVAEIQAEIAKVKQEIATRDMYRQPQSRVGWASYVGTGDRGLLDAYQNREDQYNKMMKQQQFQAAERALQLKHQHDERLAQQAFQAVENERNRQNAYDIASMNKNSESRSAKMKEDARAQLEADIAQAEYEDALSKYDTNDPNTKLALQRAALKLNYANKNLGYYDPTKIPDVNPDYSVDGPVVTKRKQITNLSDEINLGLSSKDSNTDPWNNEKRDNVNELIDRLVDLDPSKAKEFRALFNKMPATVEDRIASDNAIVAKFNNMSANEQRIWLNNNTGTAKRLRKRLKKKYKG